MDFQPLPSLISGREGSLIQSESSKVHCDLFQPRRWYPNTVTASLSFSEKILSLSFLYWFYFSLAFCALHLFRALGERRKHTAEFDSATSGVWKGWPWNVLCQFSAMGANPN